MELAAEYLAPNQLAVYAAISVLAWLGKRYVDRDDRREKADRRQDVAGARLEERLAAFDQRLSQHSDRLHKVEEHGRDIGDIKVAFGRLEERLENLVNVVKSLASSVERVLARRD